VADSGGGWDSAADPVGDLAGDKDSAWVIQSVTLLVTLPATEGQHVGDSGGGWDSAG
jgi:hypothetical protein